MQSRRASPRIPYEEAVCLTQADGNGRLYGRGMDIGTGGMAVLCTEAGPTGADVRCDLLLPGGPRPVSGRIVRVTAAPGGFELAIEFLDLKPGVTALIEDLVATRAKQMLQSKEPIAGGEAPNALVGAEEALAASGTIRKIAVDPSSGDGVPRVALEGDPEGAPREQTKPYGAPRATPTAPSVVKLLPTSLPPVFGQPLPSVLVEPDLGASEETPTPVALARPPRLSVAASDPDLTPAAPSLRAQRPKRPPPLRGTAVVARRPVPVPWSWQQPAVVVVAPAPVLVPARRWSLLDAPLSARSLMLLAPIVAVVIAVVIQLSR